MTNNGKMPLFKSANCDSFPGDAIGVSSWSKDVVVVVLTVMKPPRFSRRTMLKVVCVTMLLTVVSCFLLVSMFPSATHTAESAQRSISDNHFSGRRKLRLTAKDGNSQPKNVHNHTHMHMHGDSQVIWDISKYKSSKDATPVCKSTAVLLIIITSAPQNWERRKAIRNTWCNFTRMSFSEHSWQCAFMIGQTSNQSDAAHIHHESDTFGDILRGSYLDVYRNLTLKVIHGFDWAVNNCPHMKYLLKTDDDCFVNTGFLYHFLLNRNHVRSELYVGNVFSAEEKRTVVRFPKSRWYVSVQDYDADSYPRYASGTGYVMSRDVLIRLVEMSRYVRPFPVEDAYVGYLVSKLGTVDPILSSRFTLHGSGWTVCNFLYLMVIHGIEPHRQLEMLDRSFLASHKDCHSDGSETSWR